MSMLFHVNVGAWLVVGCRRQTHFFVESGNVSVQLF